MLFLTDPLSSKTESEHHFFEMFSRAYWTFLFRKYHRNLTKYYFSEKKLVQHQCKVLKRRSLYILRSVAINWCLFFCLFQSSQFDQVFRSLSIFKLQKTYQFIPIMLTCLTVTWTKHKFRIKYFLLSHTGVRLPLLILVCSTFLSKCEKAFPFSEFAATIIKRVKYLASQ